MGVGMLKSRLNRSVRQIGNGENNRRPLIDGQKAAVETVLQFMPRLSFDDLIRFNLRTMLPRGFCLKLG